MVLSDYCDYRLCHLEYCGNDGDDQPHALGYTPTQTKSVHTGNQLPWNRDESLGRLPAWHGLQVWHLHGQRHVPSMETPSPTLE